MRVMGIHNSLLWIFIIQIVDIRNVNQMLPPPQYLYTMIKTDAVFLKMILLFLEKTFI
jgi:hypothetical protein